MKRLFVLVALSLMSVLGMAQDLELYKSDDSPSLKRWGGIVDFERASTIVHMYNLTGLYGVNFAGGHLFLGAGLSATYMHSPEETFTYVAKRWVDGNEVREEETSVVDPGVNKALLSLVVNFRYQILTKYNCSPIFQFRSANAFASGDSYFSYNTGFCYNLKGNKQLEFTVGFLIADYKCNSTEYGFDTLLNLGVGFKF